MFPRMCVFPGLLVGLLSWTLCAAPLERGAGIYVAKCVMCHQANGQGRPAIYPPLAGSEWLWSTREQAIRALCEGLSGPIEVAGQRYDNLMPAQILNDEEVAAVLSYAAQSWGNTAAPFSPAEVQTVRRTSHFANYEKNLGPAGGGSGMSTFDPHSCPGGTIWCGDDFPAPLRGSFLMRRFGNLLGPPAAPEDVGFDLLSVRVERQAGGRWAAHTHTVLAPLARPLDVLSLGRGRVLILEYTRPTDFKSKRGWLPGRILELAPGQ